jgi:hypothetical protein
MQTTPDAHWSTVKQKEVGCGQLGRLLERRSVRGASRVDARRDIVEFGSVVAFTRACSGDTPYANILLTLL